MTPSDYVCKYMLSCLDRFALDLVYHNCHMRYVFQRKCRSPFFVPYLSFPMWTKRWIYYIYHRTFCWHMKLSAAHLHPHIQHENTIIHKCECKVRKLQVRIAKAHTEKRFISVSARSESCKSE